MECGQKQAEFLDFHKLRIDSQEEIKDKPVEPPTSPFSKFQQPLNRRRESAAMFNTLNDDTIDQFNFLNAPIEINNASGDEELDGEYKNEFVDVTHRFPTPNLSDYGKYCSQDIFLNSRSETKLYARLIEDSTKLQLRSEFSSGGIESSNQKEIKNSQQCSLLQVGNNSPQGKHENILSVKVNSSLKGLATSFRKKFNSTDQTVEEQQGIGIISSKIKTPSLDVSSETGSSSLTTASSLSGTPNSVDPRNIELPRSPDETSTEVALSMEEKAIQIIEQWKKIVTGLDSPEYLTSEVELSKMKIEIPDFNSPDEVAKSIHEFLYSLETQDDIDSKKVVTPNRPPLENKNSVLPHSETQIVRSSLVTSTNYSISLPENGLKNPKIYTQGYKYRQDSNKFVLENQGQAHVPNTFPQPFSNPIQKIKLPIEKNIAEGPNQSKPLLLSNLVSKDELITEKPFQFQKPLIKSHQIAIEKPASGHLFGGTKSSKNIPDSASNIKSNYRSVAEFGTLTTKNHQNLDSTSSKAVQRQVMTFTNPRRFAKSNLGSLSSDSKLTTISSDKTPIRTPASPLSIAAKRKLENPIRNRENPTQKMLRGLKTKLSSSESSPTEQKRKGHQSQLRSSALPSRLAAQKSSRKDTSLKLKAVQGIRTPKISGVDTSSVEREKSLQNSSMIVSTISNPTRAASGNFRYSQTKTAMPPPSTNLAKK
ncbi:hypothetical protein G9A89_015471 [Geosiphon pyriformis]|nr:hypothetical protein G9A89_015471 [Geosiphon pyriformis]